MRSIQQQRRDPMRVLKSRLIAVGLLILTAAMFQGVWGVYQKERDSRALRAEAEAQLRDLEVREAELREDIAILRTERGLEEELRERYDLAREGEGVVVIVDTQPHQAPPEPPTPLERIRGWFFW